MTTRTITAATILTTVLILIHWSTARWHLDDDDDDDWGDHLIFVGCATCLWQQWQRSYALSSRAGCYALVTFTCKWELIEFAPVCLRVLSDNDLTLVQTCNHKWIYTYTQLPPIKSIENYSNNKPVTVCLSRRDWVGECSVLVIDWLNRCDWYWHTHLVRDTRNCHMFALQPQCRIDTISGSLR